MSIRNTMAMGINAMKPNTAMPFVKRNGIAMRKKLMGTPKINIASTLNLSLIHILYLRFKTGDEGNLLVHSVVFLGSFFIVYFLLYILWRLKEKHTN